MTQPTPSTRPQPAPSQPRTAERSLPFSDETLFVMGAPPVYMGRQLNEIAFPLGGIGAGCIALGGRGQLQDWEIFNRPNKGYRPNGAFFTLFAQEEGAEPIFRVLEGRLEPPFQGPLHKSGSYTGFGFGPPVEWGSGLLRMDECRFTGPFPFARVDLSDSAVPVEVSNTAWSPFIPLNDADSSLPVAIFEVTLRNTAAHPVRATVALGLQNVIGYPDVGHSVNDWVEGNGYRGIVMSTKKHPPGTPRTGSLALLTPHPEVTYQLRSRETAWFSASESLLDDFGTTGEFPGPRDPVVSSDHAGDIAHLGLRCVIAPGEETTLTFVLSWLMPNFERYWGENSGTGSQMPGIGGTIAWPTYQGLRWEDAHAVGRYVIANLPRLRSESRRFADAFHGSTLPVYVLDAISSQMATLRSPTVTRLPDGTLWGWEGCMSGQGCCEGTCTHVWAYAQTLAFLFPQLERGIREAEFAADLRESDGHMQFRMPLPPGTEGNHAFHAAVDGQMGCVLRTYREWQICGDDAWLRRLWPAVKRTLEYAWIEWDADRDGILEGVHHNTLDIEFHGPETMCGSMYLAGLRAGEAMARYLGDDAAADAYRRVFESGRALSDATLYDGEYYFQKLAPGDVPPYQFGPGCIADQLLGQWHARIFGLGDLYDIDHVRSAVAAIFRHNFRDDLYNHHNPHRVFAINDERALLVCTWPKGGRPPRSTPYAFECFTGVESQVGAHLIYEGYLREGLTICKAVRDRHDGYRRNPYNEFECGSHYARALSNYSYLLALSGFRYEAPARRLHFNPLVFRDDFRCFFSVEGAWGTIAQRRTNQGLLLEISVLGGQLALDEIVAGDRTIPAERLTPRSDGGYTVTL